MKKVDKAIKDGKLIIKHLIEKRDFSYEKETKAKSKNNQAAKAK